MSTEKFVVTKRHKDKYRVISLRIREDTLMALDEIRAETKHSRNELINIIIDYGMQRIKIAK